jgi:hypothetical protein
MMTDHEHEWSIGTGGANCRWCGPKAYLTDKQIEAILNEHAELKKGGYYELIMAVVNKHEGESRHETALRYIKERENQEGRVAMSNALRETVLEEALCFECTKSIALCVCPDGFYLGDPKEVDDG